MSTLTIRRHSFLWVRMRHGGAIGIYRAYGHSRDHSIKITRYIFSDGYHVSLQRAAGGLALNSFQVVVSIYYIKMKFLIRNLVGEINGNQTST